ncbi:MAG: hypothetical protein LKK00_05495 [Intestinimonas sp.]|jgi:hypothetical protein|nr:hypothetical protein [Intestinimonas sp.]
MNAAELALSLIPIILSVLYIGCFLGVELLMADFNITIPLGLALLIPILSVATLFIALGYNKKPLLKRVRLAANYLFSGNKLLFNLCFWSNVYLEAKAQCRVGKRRNKHSNRCQNWPGIAKIFTDQYLAACTGLSRC